MGLLIRDLDEFNPPVTLPEGRVMIRLLKSGAPGMFIEILVSDRGVTEQVLTVPSGVSIEEIPVPVRTRSLGQASLQVGS